MRQISRLSVIAVSTALLITLSSCSSTQSTLEADDQPSTPIENRDKPKTIAFYESMTKLLLPCFSGSTLR